MDARPAVKIVHAQNDKCRGQHHEEHQNGKHRESYCRGIFLCARSARLWIAFPAAISAITVIIAIVISRRWLATTAAADVFDDEFDVV